MGYKRAKRIMKRIIMLTMFVLSSYLVFAQKIVHDENLSDYRKIQTNYYPLVKKGLIEIPMSLVYFKYTESSLSHYSIVVKLTLGSTRQSLPKGSKLYVKLENGEIIEGESMFEINTFDNEHEYLEALHTMYYYMYPQYKFSEADIEKMISDKVVKVRFQVTWGNGYFDLPNNQVFKDKHMQFTGSLSAMKNAIDTRVNQASSQSDILQGF